MSHSGAEAWQFIVDLYAKPGVELLCLQLQEQYGADVILLLWAQWLTEQRVELTPDLLELALRRVQPWRQQVLLPLRQSRKATKLLESVPTVEDDSKPRAEIYAVLKSAELAVEHQQLRLLAELFEEWSRADRFIVNSPGAQHNVRNYLTTLGLTTVPAEWLVLLET